MRLQRILTYVAVAAILLAVARSCRVRDLDGPYGRTVLVTGPAHAFCEWVACGDHWHIAAGRRPLKSGATP